MVPAEYGSSQNEAGGYRKLRSRVVSICPPMQESAVVPAQCAGRTGRSECTLQRLATRLMVFGKWMLENGGSMELEDSERREPDRSHCAPCVARHTGRADPRFTHSQVRRHGRGRALPLAATADTGTRRCRFQLIEYRSTSMDALSCR